ncbi:MAG: ubiquinone/menaquinone biosynthesis methyltransferase [Acidobacteria bacterium]|nr:ubiquinone/menaquinone biosynthesis methyltransferase [Acidobacteriota bacterium]
MRAIFDSIARRYDITNDLLSLGYHRLWERKAIQALGIRRGDRLLDLGAGSGRMTLRALRAEPGLGRAVLVDISPRMLLLAHQALRSSSSIAACVVGDGELLPVAGESFDIAILAYSLRNMPDRARAVGELHRALVPGGRLVVLEFSRPSLPGLASLYSFYLRRVIPFVGGVVTGNRSAYDHLRDSIGAFPEPGELLEMLERSGFRDAVRRPLTFGIASLYCATNSEQARSALCSDG